MAFPCRQSPPSLLHCAIEPCPSQRVSSKTKKILTTLEPPSAARASASLLGGEGVRRRSTEEDEEELEEQKMVAEESERAAKEGAGAGAKSARKRPQDRPFDYTIKLLLLGDSGVGKTSIMHRYADQKFSPSLLSTAGVDYKTKYLKVNGKTVKCQIWDTAGQQRFHIITQTYYRGAHGIILVYDASDPSESSFSNVRYWMKSIKDHSSPSTQKILLGNKIDVPHKQIDSARGKATAEEYGIGFWETSAKDGTNVSKAFNAIAKDIVERMALGPPAGHDPPVAPPDTAGKADPGKRCVVM